MTSAQLPPAHLHDVAAGLQLAVSVVGTPTVPTVGPVTLQTGGPEPPVPQVSVRVDSFQFHAAQVLPPSMVTVAAGAGPETSSATAAKELTNAPAYAREFPANVIPDSYRRLRGPMPAPADVDYRFENSNLGANSSILGKILPESWKGMVRLPTNGAKAWLDYFAGSAPRPLNGAMGGPEQKKGGTRVPPFVMRQDDAR